MFNAQVARTARGRARSALALVPYFTSLLIAGIAPLTSAQTTPDSATLTRWDIFAATGGTGAGSANATRNPLAVAVDPIDGSVWFVAQRPAVRLGRLDPQSSANNYLEWAPSAGSGAAPVGLTVNPVTRDVWFTSGGPSELLMKEGGADAFRAYRIPLSNAVLHRFGVTSDGSAAVVPVKAGSNTSIYSIPRAADPLGGTQRVTATRWRFPNSSDDPRHLALDGADKIWYTNRYRNTLARLDPTGPATSNLTSWRLPAGTNPSGLHIVNGAGSTGAVSVCVVTESTLGTLSGAAMCLDVASNTLFTFTRPSGFDYAQQVARNEAGELFLTEQNGNAVSFIDAAASTSPAVVLPMTGSAGVRYLQKVTTATSIEVTDQTGASPIAATVAPTVMSVAGAADAAGHRRFVLPSFAALPDQPGLLRESRPVGMSQVLDGASPGTGTLYIAEYSDGPLPMQTRMGGAISQFTFNRAAPDTLRVLPRTLTFEGPVGEPAPPSQILSIEEEHGRTIEWTATATQPWLTLSAPSGSTPASLTVSVDHGQLEARETPYEDTVTIDDGPGGAKPVEVPIALNVVHRPTMVVTPLLLTFDAVNTDTTPPAPKTFAISSTGGGTLEWTAAVNIPGVEAELEVAGQPREVQLSGSGPATVTLHIGSVPGTLGLRKGTVVITSTNALNPSETIDITYNVTSVIQTLLVDKQSLTFSAPRGGGVPAPQTIRITNAGGTPNTWGSIFPYTEAVQPSWVTLSPQVATLNAGSSTDVVVSINTAALAPGSHSGVITLDDHTGNSPPATIGILMTVQAPTIEFSTDNITLDANGDEPASTTFVLTNSGDAPLTFTPQVNVNEGSGWLSVSPLGEATLAPGESTTFTATITTASLSAGRYTAQVTVADPRSTNGSDTVFLTVVVADSVLPALTLPAALTVPATGASGAVVTYAASASDEGDSIAITCSPASGAIFPLGLTTVTCSATDAAGNAATGSFAVTVIDPAGPTVSVPASMTLEAAGAAGAVASFVASASDLVDGVLPVSCAPASGSTFALGTTVVSCSATDTAGNSASASFTVTVRDTTPPVLSLPANIDMTAASDAGVPVTYAATANDLVSGSVGVTCAPPSGSTFAAGATTVTCSAADAAGNVASGTLTVTVTLVAVTDTTPPVVSVPAAVVDEATGPGGAAVSFTASALDDIDGALPVTCSPLSGHTFVLGTTTVTCSATDAAGNTGQASFPVTVSDTTAPVLTLPADMTTAVTSEAGAVVSYTATASDLVSGAVPPACLPASGGTFPVGTTTVSCTAADPAGNTTTGSFVITVTPDVTAPVFTVLPQNQTVQATGPAGAVATFAATATDAVSTPTISYSHASGSTFPIGTTTVTVTARDAALNTATATFTITVLPPPTSFTTNVSSLYYKTGRLAYCNGMAVGPNWKDQGLVVTNTGGVALNYSVTTATSWIRVVPASGSVATGASTTLTVSVDLSGLARGIYQGSLTLTGNGEVSQVVPVTLEIGNALPTLCLTPTTTLLGTVKARKVSATKYFDVLNVGDDPLGSWTLTKTATQGTVYTTVASGTGPRTIGVSVKAGTKKGSQSGKVTINAPGAVQSGQTVNLSWTVQ